MQNETNTKPTREELVEALRALVVLVRSDGSRALVEALENGQELLARERAQREEAKR